jgi:DNA topoisomerase-3
VILQRPVERAQMEKLLATGKTDLLQFVSARTKRGFSAFLVRQPTARSASSSRRATRPRPGRAGGGAAPAAFACWGRIRATRSRWSFIPGVIGPT